MKAPYPLLLSVMALATAVLIICKYSASKETTLQTRHSLDPAAQRATTCAEPSTIEGPTSPAGLVLNPRESERLNAEERAMDLRLEKELRHFRMSSFERKKIREYALEYDSFKGNPDEDAQKRIKALQIELKEILGAERYTQYLQAQHPYHQIVLDFLERTTGDGIDSERFKKWVEFQKEMESKNGDVGSGDNRMSLDERIIKFRREAIQRSVEILGVSSPSEIKINLDMLLSLPGDPG